MNNCSLPDTEQWSIGRNIYDNDSDIVFGKNNDVSFISYSEIFR